jgi:hypothetical protein
MVRTTAAGQAALTYTGAGQGRDVIVATATLGPLDLRSNTARVTWGAGQHQTFLTLNPSPTGGAPGQPISVRASLSDTSVQPPAPVAGAGIDFVLGSARCSGPTDPQGLAACQITPGDAGKQTLAATFAGTARLLPASDAVGFTVLGTSAPPPPPPGCAGVDCDDGDVCTNDACDQGQCQHVRPAGFGGVTCYLDALTGNLKGAARSDVRPGIKKKLLARVRQCGKLVQGTQRPGKRGAKAHRKLGKKLDALVSQLERFRGGKVAAPLGDTLVALARGARSALP